MRLQAIGLASLYAGGSAAAALFAVNPTDLDAFFLPSAREALSGHPLHVYTVRHDTLYPNANGPLSLVPLTAVAAAASRLGWIDDPRLRRILVMAAFSVFSMLLAREAVGAIDRSRGGRLTGRARALTYALFAAPPLIWHSVLLYGHVEQPLCLWLVLWAVRALAVRRMAQAGVLMGCAILDRTIAVLYLAALVLSALRDRGRGPAMVFATAAALTVAAGLAPFLIADGPDTVFSLVTFRGALPIGGGSIWQLATGTAAEGVGQHADGVAAIALAAGAVALVVWRRGRREPGDRTVFGVLALAALCFPLAVKTVWPYYFLDAYVLGAVWALGRRGSWQAGTVVRAALLPAIISGCAFLAEVGVDTTTSLALRRAESVAMFVVLVVAAVGLGRALLRDYGTAVGSAGPGTGVGATDGDAAPGAPGAEGTGTPDGGADTGAEVGPSGGVGQLASATLKGVGDGFAVGLVPAGGVT